MLLKVYYIQTKKVPKHIFITHKKSLEIKCYFFVKISKQNRRKNTPWSCGKIKTQINNAGLLKYVN